MNSEDFQKSGHTIKYRIEIKNERRSAKDDAPLRLWGTIQKDAG